MWFIMVALRGRMNIYRMISFARKVLPNKRGWSKKNDGFFRDSPFVQTCLNKKEFREKQKRG